MALLFSGIVAMAAGWLVGAFAVRHPLSGKILRAFRAARLRLRPAGAAAASRAR